MKITVTKPDGTIIVIDLCDESPVVEQPISEPVYDDDELGDEPSWNAPDSPQFQDPDLEDWGAAGTEPDDFGGSDE